MSEVMKWIIMNLIAIVDLRQEVLKILSLNVILIEVLQLFEYFDGQRLQ